MQHPCILVLLCVSFASAQQLQWYTPGNVAPQDHYLTAWAYDSERDRIVLAGGTSNPGYPVPNYFDDTLEWDGVAWLARPVPSFPIRVRHQMAFDPSRRRIVMFGGLYGFFWNHFGGLQPLGDTYEYDGLRWSLVSTTGPSPRSGHAMTWDPMRQRVLLYGGNASDTWAWDGTNWTMLNVPGPPARSNPAHAYDTVRNRWVIFGGTPLGTNVPLGDLWEWDGVAWMQRTPAVSPPARAGAGMAYDPVRSLCVLGGGDLWEWNGTNWTQAAAPPMSGWGAAAFHAGRGAVMFFDGTNFESWDGQTLRSESYFSIPSAGVLAALGPRILVFNNSATWERSNPAWNFIGSGMLFPGGIAVEDTSRNRVVCVQPLFQSTYVNEFDGTAWYGPMGGGMFSARLWPAVAFDRSRGVTVLFGGYDGGGSQQDTWEWNGSLWAQPTPTTAPGARWNAAMCWDPQLGEVLLFGGQVGPTSPFLQDTWAWNGTNWRQLAPATQPPATRMALVLHEYEGSPWLFSHTGYTGQPGYMPGAWRWTGVDWQPVTTSPGTAAVFDRARGQFLTFSNAPQNAGTPAASYFGPHVAPQVTTRGTACVAASQFVASTPFLGNPSLRFDAFRLPGQSLGALLLGTQAANVGFGVGCTLLVGGNLAVQLFMTNGGGFASVSMSVPQASGLLGLQFHAQTFALDAVTGALVASAAQDLRLGN